jgi:hypothetical protein
VKARITFTRQAHPAKADTVAESVDHQATVEHDIKILIIDKDEDLVLHTQPGNTIVFSSDEWHAVTVLKED